MPVDVRRATDPAGRRSVPLSGYDFAAFNVPVVNTVSDRLFLAADNGLLVCLRDASAKYARFAAWGSRAQAASSAQKAAAQLKR